MLAAVDVDYRPDHALAACVLFDAWTDAAPGAVVVARAPLAAPYVPGELYRRELPPLLAVLAEARPLGRPDVVVVDGNVWLGPGADGGAGRPGLGARLHEALAAAGAPAAVVGVAKTRFAGAPTVEVLRGRSARPLHVSALGLEVERAAALVRAMHGDARIPTLLAAADRACRRAHGAARP